VTLRPSLAWSGNRFDCAGTPFVIEWAKPGPNEFWVAKHRWMIERYEQLLDSLQPQRILELGMFSGGSTALIALLVRPEKLVGVDLVNSLPSHFQDWLVEQGLAGRVSTHFDIDQSDVATLSALVEAEFGDEPLDLVIDDASHLLEPSTASFNALFPRLRTGGVYVLEDWSWQLAFEGALDGDSANKDQALQGIRSQIPMAQLALEIILASAYGDVIDDVSLRGEWLAVRRGPGVIAEPDTFRLSDCYGDLGRTLLSR
jgi:predicted O-methyltransferase YrrM